MKLQGLRSSFCFVITQTGHVMQHLFAYGSLMYPQVIAQVLGYTPTRSMSAQLMGWQRRALKNRSYPAAIAQATSPLDSVILGVLWMDLTQQDFLRLDAFESHEYRRVAVTVFSADHPSIPAAIYEWQDRRELLDHDWSETEFKTRHLSGFYEQHRID